MPSLAGSIVLSHAASLSFEFLISLSNHVATVSSACALMAASKPAKSSSVAPNFLDSSTNAFSHSPGSVMSPLASTASTASLNI